MDNLTHLLSEIDSARAAALQPASAVELVAVSKGQDEAKIRPALDAGHRIFGENRVQEAQAKWPTLRKTYPNISLHLIGPLQTNKVADALALFDVIETLDRPKLAHALAEHRSEASRLKSCFIQVNTGAEMQKAGILPEEADDFIDHCRDELQLPVTGLMCIPPFEENPAPHFGLLREIARRNHLQQLSMGMSGDFETAIRFGATQVRIGTALFGARG